MFRYKIEDCPEKNFIQVIDFYVDRHFTLVQTDAVNFHTEILTIN